MTWMGARVILRAGALPASAGLSQSENTRQLSAISESPGLPGDGQFHGSRQGSSPRTFAAVTQRSSPWSWLLPPPEPHSSDAAWATARQVKSSSTRHLRICAAFSSVTAAGSTVPCVIPRTLRALPRRRPSDCALLSLSLQGSCTLLSLYRSQESGSPMPQPRSRRGAALCVSADRAHLVSRHRRGG